MEGFPGDNGAIAAQWVQAAPGSKRFVFLDLPPGRYAVAFFHGDDCGVLKKLQVIHGK